MTRKDFILISSAIRAAKEGLLVKLPKDTTIRQAMLNSIELSALHIGKALLAEQGARFDFGRFLTDCGYGGTPTGRLSYSEPEMQHLLGEL